MSDERIDIKIGGDGSGAIREMAAVAAAQARLTQSQITQMKLLGASETEIAGLQRQQNLQLERNWKLREKAADVQAKATGDARTVTKEALQIEQERLAITTARVQEERAAAAEAERAAEAARRAADEAERAAQAERIKLAQGASGIADSRVGLVGSRLALAQAQGAEEGKIQMLLAAQRREQEAAWRARLKAVAATGDEAAVLRTKNEIQAQHNHLVAQEIVARNRAAMAATKAGQLSSLGTARQKMGGDPLELASGLREAEAAAIKLGGPLAGINQKLAGIGAARQHTRMLYGELDRISTVALKAGAAILTIGAGLVAAAIKGGGELAMARRQQIAALEALTGGAAAAKTELAELQEIAKQPSLNLDQAIQADLKLRNAGAAAELAHQAIKEFGNAAAASGAGPEKLGLALEGLSQMFSKGQVASEELRQQVLEHLPAIGPSLEKAFGTRSAEAIAAMNLSVEEFTQRLLDVMATSERVSGGLPNSVENIKDAWTEVKIAFGDGMFGPDSQANAEKLAGNLDKLRGSAKQLGEAIVPLIDKAVEFTVALTDNDGAMIKWIGTMVGVGGGLLALAGGIGKGIIAYHELTIAIKAMGVAQSAAGAGMLATVGWAGAVVAALAVMTWSIGRTTQAYYEMVAAQKAAAESARRAKQAFQDNVDAGYFAPGSGPKIPDRAPGFVDTITPWKTRNERDWEEYAAAPTPQVIGPKVGDRIVDQQVAKQKREAAEAAKQSAKATSDEEKSLNDVLMLDEKRLEAARVHIDLVKAQNPLWSKYEDIWLKVEEAQQAADEAQRQVLRDQLKIAEAEGDAAKIQAAKMDLATAETRIKTDGLERERALQDAIADREREEENRRKQQAADLRALQEEIARQEQARRDKALADAKTFADLKLSAAAAEVQHAERMGASARQLAELKSAEKNAQEEVWKRQLEIAREQVKAGRDSLALKKTELEIEQDRRAIAMEEAEQRRRERLEAMGTQQRLVEMAKDQAEKQAKLAELQGNTAYAAGWKAEVERLQEIADRLALTKAAAEDPNGERRLVQLQQGEITGRKLDEQIADAEKARQERDKLTRETAPKRLSKEDLIQSSLNGDRKPDKLSGPSTGSGQVGDRLQTAVIGGDVGRVSDILQAARRAGGGRSSAEDPLVANMRRPQTDPLRREIADALEERDRRQREAMLDGIRGRGR